MYNDLITNISKWDKIDFLNKIEVDYKLQKCLILYQKKNYPLHIWFAVGRNLSSSYLVK